MLATYAPNFLTMQRGIFSGCFPFVKISKNAIQRYIYFFKNNTIVKKFFGLLIEKYLNRWFCAFSSDIKIFLFVPYLIFRA